MRDPAQQDSDRLVAAPEGYEDVQTLLVKARRAQSQERLKPSDWVRVREAMPDQMPTRRSMWTWLVAGGVVVAAAAMAIAFMPQAPPRPAEVAPAVASAVRGGLNAPRPPSVVASAVASPRLVAGAVLVADAGDALTWTGFGRHNISLTAGSTAKLVIWSAEAVEILLVKGTISCDVQRAGATESFVVRSAGTVVRVVGTTFDVSVDDAGATTVAVKHGEVAVQRGDVVRRLRAGATWTGAAKVAAAVAPPELAEAPAVGATAPAVERSRAAKRDSKGRTARSKRAKRIERTKRISGDGTKGAAEGRGGSRAEVGGPTQPEPDGKTQTVEIDVAVDSDPSGGGTGARKLLTSAVGLIRGARGGAAKSRLRGIYRRLGAKTPAELFYLMAYCLHAEGKHSSAKAFFAKYRQLARSRSFKLPAGPQSVLPMPRSSQLSR